TSGLCTCELPPNQHWITFAALRAICGLQYEGPVTYALSVFFCLRSSKQDGQDDLQYSGYLLCLGNRKKKIFQRLLLAFAKLVCSPVAGVITAVSTLRGLVSRQVQDMTTVIHNTKISQDLLLHIQGRAEIILL
ncbi:hypothetical protein PO909_006915, partial [Leuciscus waleckii]